MKHCPDCKQDKPLSDFHRNRSKSDGLQRICKVCTRKYARPNIKRPLTEELLHEASERFWSYVNIVEGDGCWEWQGLKHNRGDYGLLNIGGRNIFAHRASWMLAHGPIPSTVIICHKCDNPPCVRLDHLFAGTQADNLQDAARKGRTRSNPKRGIENHKSKLTPDQVREIRTLYGVDGHNFVTLARKYGITKQSVKAVVDRTSWKHIE